MFIAGRYPNISYSIMTRTENPDCFKMWKYISLYNSGFWLEIFNVLLAVFFVQYSVEWNRKTQISGIIIMLNVCTLKNQVSLGYIDLVMGIKWHLLSKDEALGMWAIGFVILEDFNSSHLPHLWCTLILLGLGSPIIRETLFGWSVLNYLTVLCLSFTYPASSKQFLNILAHTVRLLTTILTVYMEYRPGYTLFFFF